MELEELIRRMQKFDMHDAINEAVKDHEKEIIHMNTNDQLYDKGIADTGRKIVPPYAASTVRMKKKTHRPYNRVTLYQSNSFYGSFKLLTFREQFEINSQHKVKGFNLAQHLRERYGTSGDIMGLTKENIAKTARMIAPDIITIARREVLNG